MRNIFAGSSTKYHWRCSWPKPGNHTTVIGAKALLPVNFEEYRKYILYSICNI
jgi:hypothetical protein